MRCFAALVPPAAFLAGLETVLLPPIRVIQGWRPVRLEGVHVTLAFMADAGPAKVDAAVAAVNGTATRARSMTSSDWARPISLCFGPLKPFPSAARPKVLAIEPIQGADDLAGLWNGFNGIFHREALARGLPRPNPEWQPGGRFRPHLSLARPVIRSWQGPSVHSAQAVAGSPAVLDDFKLLLIWRIQI